MMSQWDLADWIAAVVMVLVTTTVHVALMAWSDRLLAQEAEHNKNYPDTLG